MFEVSNISVKVTVLLYRFLFTKSLFSPFFGQKQVFLGKPTFLLLPITTELKKVETNFFFPDERRESTLSLGSFGVYIVTEHTVLWVLGKSVKML